LSKPLSLAAAPSACGGDTWVFFKSYRASRQLLFYHSPIPKCQKILLLIARRRRRRCSKALRRRDPPNPKNTLIFKYVSRGFVAEILMIGVLGFCSADEKMNHQSRRRSSCHLRRGYNRSKAHWKKLARVFFFRTSSLKVGFFRRSF
jgi:hypothetical protein